MISEENVKMGNKALADDAAEPTSGNGSRSLNTARIKESVNTGLRRAGSQALVLRDKVYENPKLTAGIALATIGGVWAISRAMSARSRRQRTVTKLLAAAGLWRVLAPLWKAARKKAPKVQKQGMSRLNELYTLLQENAGPVLNKYVPKAVKRLSH